MSDGKKSNRLESADNPTDGQAAGNDKRRSRRRLIQVLTAGGVITSAKLLPTEWAQPVVESVSLPAHAQTTGEVIELGNNEPFGAAAASPPERPESLLASGVETAGDMLRRVITAAHAGDEPDDTLVGCQPNGCARIRFVLGQTIGTLFMGIFDETADGLLVDEIAVPFVDGANGNFAGTCLEPLGITYRVDLGDAFSALLTLSDGGKKVFPVTLVRNFFCSPVLRM